MKRFIVLALAALVTCSAWAQGTFTIRRPLDGATVRETVSVRIPKNSIPDGGYIGVFVNGAFLEAVLPDIEGEDYVYKLDTQARKLDDGPAKIEAVLYVDVNGKPQVVNRSSVNVNIDNHTSIKVPKNGIRLRYSFKPGVEHVYRFTFNQEVGTISQAQAALNSRVPMTTVGEETARILYATDNAYGGNGGRQGLLRIQLLPDKGKDYATLTPVGQTEPMKINSDELSAFFMRITDVGREVFSSVPLYFGIEGQNGSAPDIEYFPLLPLPVLPTKAVKPGDVWQATELFAQMAPDQMLKEKITIPVPARGELEGLTWYKGMPCAVIHTVISVGPELLKNVKNLNNIKGDASNINLEGRTWFAIDRGTIARMQVDLTQESMVTAGSGDSMLGTGGGSGSGGGDARTPGRKGSGGGMMGPPGGGGDWFLPDGTGYSINPSTDDKGNVSIFQLGGRRGGRRGGGAGVASEGGPGGQDQNDEASSRGGQNGPGGRFGQRNGGGGGGSRKMVMRVHLSYVAELER